MGEIGNWPSRAAEKVIRRAALTLRAADQERFQEEWLAELSEVRGNVASLIYSLRIAIHARRLRITAQKEGSESKKLTKESEKVSYARYRFSLSLALGLLGVVVAALLGLISFKDTSIAADVAGLAGAAAAIMTAAFTALFERAKQDNGVDEDHSDDF